MKNLIYVPVGAEPSVRKYERSAVGEYLHYSYSESIYIETKLKDLINDLTCLQKKYRDRYRDIAIESKRDCGCYFLDCGCSPSYKLYGYRYETDLEYEFRIKKELLDQRRKEEQELAQYEKLKQKFETKDSSE